jgi:hypothetical protein
MAMPLDKQTALLDFRGGTTKVFTNSTSIRRPHDQKCCYSAIFDEVQIREQYPWTSGGLNDNAR